VGTDTFGTIAEYRHPEQVDRTAELRDDERYRLMMARAEQLLDDAADCGDRGLAVRVMHDLLVRWSKDLAVARGRVIHDLIFDHSYEEVAAMVGLSRQRINDIHREWMDKTSTPPWPTSGRWERITTRRKESRSQES
jgi:hypothetical protein